MSAVVGVVSDEAYEAWCTLSAEEGCSFAALLEALGLRFAHHGKDDFGDVFKEARRIDAERRRR